MPIPLCGFTLPQLEEIVAALNMPRFTAKQIAEWLYVKRVKEIEDMTNISKANRIVLSQKYCVGYNAPIEEMRSKDGTAKYLFEVAGGKNIESVYIPDKERATLCVSSQVGCKMGCVFCMTGKQGFNGQLTTAQIINQIVSIPESNTLTNLVFMGMGEPLDNIDEVLRALDILTASWGFAWSPRRITVSSIGLQKQLLRLINESECHIAISLHSPYAAERLAIMPIEKASPAANVIKLLSQYDFSHQRRLSFEYILFSGYNDTLEHAAALAELLKGVMCRINLIRFHKIPDVDLASSNETSAIAFRDFLTHRNLICTIRSSRGEDIFAACGMLSTAKNNQNKV